MRWRWHSGVVLFTLFIASGAEAVPCTTADADCTEWIKIDGGPSRVLVYRQMNAKLEDGSGSFHGFVRPKWNRRVVYLEKRSCAACNYHRVRSTKSGPHGYFRFVVPAPRSGRWWWRASTPATGRFIWSYSAVFTTQLN